MLTIKYLSLSRRLNNNFMHELSIVMNIVDIAEDETAKAEASSVTSITLEIGTLSGIVMEALEFAWQSAIKGTVLENAELKINTIEGVAKCWDCGEEFNAQTLYQECPQCKGYFTDIIKGKEMRVMELTVE